MPKRSDMKIRGSSRWLALCSLWLVASCASGPDDQSASLTEATSTETESATAPATVVESAAPDWQARRALVVIPITLTRNHFEPTLAVAIKQALAIDPNLHLDLVAVAPVLNSPKDQEKVDEIAKASAGEVAIALSRLGLDQTRVRQFSTSDETAAVPEIRLYPE